MPAAFHNLLAVTMQFGQKFKSAGFLIIQQSVGEPERALKFIGKEVVCKSDQMQR